MPPVNSDEVPRNFERIAEARPFLIVDDAAGFELEPDYQPGEYSFRFDPQKDISGYEVLLCLPIILNLQHPEIGGQLLALLNEHKHLRRHWPISNQIVEHNGVQLR